jgi:hypothetical protein
MDFLWAFCKKTVFFLNVSAQFLGNFRHQFGVISQSAATINGADLNATSPTYIGGWVEKQIFPPDASRSQV